MIGSEQLRDLLSAVGELLEAEGETASIVVVGGASLCLRGIVERTTDDVDVIARADPSEEGKRVELVRPDPLPEALRDAVARVGRDYGLDPHWLNTEIADQWKTGLPPSLETSLTWRRFGGLRVGIAGRQSLIALKLFAAVDQGPESVHYQDLLALAPTDEELQGAAEWITSQDPYPSIETHVEQVIDHVRRDAQ